MAHPHPRRVLVGAMAVFVGYTAYLIAPASVSPLLADHFRVETAAVGTAISAAYAGWLVFQLPSGYLMDRHDNRVLLAVAVAGFVVAAGGGVFAGSYVEFLLTRIVAGAAAGTLWGVGANVVGQVFPDGQRNVATGIFVASGPLGLAVGQFASPLLARELGVWATFPVYAGISLVGYALFHGAAPRRLDQSGSVRLRGFARSLMDRSVLLLALSALCGNGAWLFVNAWMPTYGTEVLSLPLAVVGGLTALAPLAGTLGRSGGGLAANRVGRRLTVAGSLALVVPVVAAFSVVSSWATFGITLLLSGFALQLGVGIYYVHVRDLLGSEFSGTGISVVASFQLLGGMIAPVAGGWLIGVASWDLAFAAVGATAAVGAGVVLLVPAVGDPEPV